MRNKYYNEAVVGNEKLKVTYTRNGELLRLIYGTIDFKQFIETYHVGLKVNDSALIYLHEDINNSYSQEYIEDTNILVTNIYNSYFKLKVVQKDFVPLKDNVLVKEYTLINENNIDLNVDLLAYSKAYNNLNNDTCGYVKNDILIQYNHDYSICTFSKNKISSVQINGSKETFPTGKVWGKDYVGMSSDSAISYELGVLKPGEETKIVLYVYVNDNSKKGVIRELEQEVDRIKKLDTQKLEEDTIKYWQKFVKEHDKLKINKSDLSYKIKKIYNRSILFFPLLSNSETGGISAGFEVDEFKTKCGRYSYCWPRDAAFITEALDIVGMEEQTEKFYSVFCKMTQNKNGMWEQRFYTDGRLAPSWGYQIDETASVVFGAYAHYKVTKDKKFLKDNLKMFESAISFIQKYVDDLLSESPKMPKSYNLWEENEGVALYSMASVYAAFNAMHRIYTALQQMMLNNKGTVDYINKQLKMLEKYSALVLEYSEEKFYDENRKSYVRNLEDGKMDSSILGAIVPCKMLKLDDEKVRNTIERINMTLRTYTGGYLRYEGDHYMDGKYPWPIATLWMAWYYLEVGEYDNALECFNFVVNSASNLGYLGEQVNNETMQPAWVFGLTWSHAMFLITLEKLIGKELL